ncbi:HAMP domain-containing methyl-accepting chemotaxis protein [Janthinobacterium sp. B9-8]|uniref:HAMP domain-containing methyl-accepting chemotaxis protein n=1 Tax=Janthinobacterium sp. B9-8 TaxID=1236179 RepID=UPI00061CF83A|nr:methyl-accepting chemotaxis protein [Janthinobacterium sp. B9-8]AMC36223.1 chemotaxis protein [Janthinobacterium sp. B9-8]
MFEKLKLKYSILLGYVLPLLFLVLVGILVYKNIKEAEEESQLVQQSQSTMQKIIMLQYHIAAFQRAARGAIIFKTDAVFKNYQSHSDGYKASLADLDEMIKDGKQKEIFKNIKTLGDELLNDTTEYIRLVDAGNNESAAAIFRTGKTLGPAAELNKLLDEFQKAKDETMKEQQKLAADAFSALLSTLVYGIIGSTLVAIGLGLFIASRITRTINVAINAAAATSSEIAATIAQHERTANQQAAMTNEMTTTLEELSVSSRQSSDQSTNAADMARNASTMTEDGNEAIRQVVEAMSGLKMKIGAIAEQILSLSEQTGQIGTITELVKDLSNQINMLALNAAVEAARAGEHGKGFSVVAAEVRKLSVESKKSAEQAKGIVSGIQKASDTTIMRTEEGTRNIETVMGIVSRVNELFESISSLSNQVYQSSQQGALNAKQQTAAIAEVVGAANTMNAGAKETAAGITQTKVGIQNLNEANNKLKAIV